MQTSEVYAELSTAKRMKVGSIIVKDDRIISIGYNGMPSGWDNTCEHEVLWGNKDGKQVQYASPQLKTKPEVLLSPKPPRAFLAVFVVAASVQLVPSQL